MTRPSRSRPEGGGGTSSLSGEGARRNTRPDVAGGARRRGLAVILGTAVIAGTWSVPSLYSWVSFFADETRGVEVLTFAPGYTGTGGTLRVTVGIDPTSAHAADMVQPVRNVV